jgi:hypothetical protein
MSQTVIYLDNLSEDQRKVCEGCSASGQTYTGMIPFPLCKPAQLEKSLGRKPKYGETTDSRIDTSVIPEGCPNGYISLLSREIR